MNNQRLKVPKYDFGLTHTLWDLTITVSIKSNYYTSDSLQNFTTKPCCCNIIFLLVRTFTYFTGNSLDNFAFLREFTDAILDRIVHWKWGLLVAKQDSLTWCIRHIVTSDSLWKIWLVESIQSIHNNLWTWHDKCNICCRYYIYHVKLNVCLVTKPLGVFSSETKWLSERFASVSEDELCEKCIIKQFLISVFAWYHELSDPHVCVIGLSRRLWQITLTSVLIIHDIMLNLIQ